MNDAKRSPAVVKEEHERATVHLQFAARLYGEQVEAGRFFLHEHPWLATSWGLDCVEKLMAQGDVRRVQTHMCQFRMMSRLGGVGSELGPVLKPTGFMTNSVHIANELQKVCPRDHTHVPLVGGRAAGAAIYPPGLCRAICRGLAAQKHEDNIGKVRTRAMTPSRLMSLSMACMQATGGYPP